MCYLMQWTDKSGLENRLYISSSTLAKLLDNTHVKAYWKVCGEDRQIIQVLTTFQTSITVLVEYI